MTARAARLPSEVFMVSCTVCGKEFDPRESPAMPFCSERCRTIDLARWLDEKNRVPTIRSSEPTEDWDEST